jgi:glycosyltransferase involved in cell wall biosynthesis
MHILFTRFPLESALGGAEIQTLSLMKGLQRKGHNVSFLGSCPTLLKKCAAFGIRHSALKIGSPPVTKWGAVLFMCRQRQMRRRLIMSMSNGAMEQWSNGAIFMLSLTEKLLLTDWAVKNRMRVFWIEHDRIGRWLTKNPWLPRLKRLSASVTTVGVSDLSRDLYRDLGFQNVVSIPNGIDVTRFTRASSPEIAACHPERSVLSLSKDAETKNAAISESCIEQSRRTQHDTVRFRIGCIARLSHEKGIDLLIDAIADMSHITLTIVGQGPLHNDIRGHIDVVNQKLKMRNQQSICLLHSVNPEEFYQSIDCLVLPSRDHDPFGLVIAEAMAAGVPTICTDACGIARHLHPNESVIVKAGNSDALREGINTVQDAVVWKRLSEKGPSVAREKFSIERMIIGYETWLQKA